MKRARNIAEKKPELAKYLDEMPLTIPIESNPEITVEKLEEYYESLGLLEEKHID